MYLDWKKRAESDGNESVAVSLEIGNGRDD
jgi:hypothetical protein